MLKNNLEAYHIKTKEGIFLPHKVADWLYIPEYSKRDKIDVIMGVIRQNIMPFGLFGRLVFEMGTQTELLHTAGEVIEGRKDPKYNQYSPFQIPKWKAEELIERIGGRRGILFDKREKIILLPRLLDNDFSNNYKLIEFLEKF